MGGAVPFPAKGAQVAAGQAFEEVSIGAAARIARICALGFGMEQLLGEICREVMALCGAESAWIAALSGDAGEPAATWVSAAGESMPDPAAFLREGDVWEAVLEELRAAGARAAPDLLRLPPDDPVRRLFEPKGIRSVVLAPLRFGTRLLGVLCLQWAARPRSFSDGMVRLVTEIAAPVIGAALDRRKTETRLKASEARYRFLAENARDVISLHDPEGRFLYASPAAARMLGYRPEELLGVPIAAFLHPEERERVMSENARMSAGEVPSVTLQHRVRRKDGGFAEVETISSAVPDDSGAVRQVLRITRDLTERKRLESRFFESQKLETIGMLAGGVAHQFNNILVGINGAVEMLSLLLAGNAEAEKYIAMIERNGARAVELTQQLLAYARRGRYRPRPVRLAPAVAEEVPLLRAALPPAVEISLDLDEEAPLVVADVTQIKQVVMSLCLNAGEAMPEGGTVTVSVRREEGKVEGPEDVVRRGAAGFERRIRAGGPLAGPFVVLEVADTGCGMDENTMRRIFEPFFSTKFVGRGMGLAAVRGIVETHDGMIRVRSEEGRGTCVSIALPAAREAPVANEWPKPHAAAAGTGLVLVADDEEDVRAMVRAMLESFGYQVIEARDGEEAVAVFRERHAEIDLVLLDLVMPRMTGEEAFEQMRRIDPSVRGLLASGYDESGRVGEIEARGFGGFLQKPFRRLELGRKVGDLLGGRGSRPPGEK